MAKPVIQEVISETPSNLVSTITEAAEAYGIPVELLSALLWAESGFDPNAVNKESGAAGIAQFMPNTIKELVRLGFNGGKEIDPLDFKQAINGAAFYLSRLAKRFGSLELGLAAYNAGPGNVSKFGGIPPFPETQNYVSKIMNKVGDLTIQEPVAKKTAPLPSPPSRPSAPTPTYPIDIGQDYALQRQGIQSPLPQRDFDFATPTPIKSALDKKTSPQVPEIKGKQGEDSRSLNQKIMEALGDIIFPITQTFGKFNPRIELFSGGINYGVDFGTPEGTPVGLPEGEWKIVEVYNNASRGFIGNSENSGYGNSVLAENVKTGEKIRLSHLQYTSYKVGETYRGGTVALTGATGNVTGPHVDVEYYDSSGKIKDITATKYASQIFLGKKTKTQINKMKKEDSPTGIEKSKAMVKKRFDELINPLFGKSPIGNIDAKKTGLSNFQNLFKPPIASAFSPNQFNRVPFPRNFTPANANLSTNRGPIFAPPPPRPQPRSNTSTNQGPVFTPAPRFTPPPPVSSGPRQNFTPSNANFSSASGFSSFVPPPPPPAPAQAARRTLASALPLGRFIFK